MKSKEFTFNFPLNHITTTTTTTSNNVKVTIASEKESVNQVTNKLQSLTFTNTTNNHKNESNLKPFIFTAPKFKKFSFSPYSYSTSIGMNNSDDKRGMKMGSSITFNFNQNEHVNTKQINNSNRINNNITKGSNKNNAINTSNVNYNNYNQNNEKASSKLFIFKGSTLSTPAPFSFNYPTDNDDFDDDGQSKSNNENVNNFNSNNNNYNNIFSTFQSTQHIQPSLTFSDKTKKNEFQFPKNIDFYKPSANLNFNTEKPQQSLFIFNSKGGGIARKEEKANEKEKEGEEGEKNEKKFFSSSSASNFDSISYVLDENEDVTFSTKTKIESNEKNNYSNNFSINDDTVINNEEKEKDIDVNVRKKLVEVKEVVNEEEDEDVSMKNMDSSSNSSSEEGGNESENSFNDDDGNTNKKDHNLIVNSTGIGDPLFNTGNVKPFTFNIPLYYPINIKNKSSPYQSNPSIKEQISKNLTYSFNFYHDPYGSEKEEEKGKDEGHENSNHPQTRHRPPKLFIFTSAHEEPETSTKEKNGSDTSLPSPSIHLSYSPTSNAPIIPIHLNKNAGQGQGKDYIFKRKIAHPTRRLGFQNKPYYNHKSNPIKKYNSQQISFDFNHDHSQDQDNNDSSSPTPISSSSSSHIASPTSLLPSPSTSSSSPLPSLSPAPKIFVFRASSAPLKGHLPSKKKEENDLPHFKFQFHTPPDEDELMEDEEEKEKEKEKDNNIKFTEHILLGRKIAQPTRHLPINPTSKSFNYQPSIPKSFNFRASRAEDSTLNPYIDGNSNPLYVFGSNYENRLKRRFFN